METPPLDAEFRNRRVARLARRYVVCIGAVHVALLAYGAFIHSPGFDEIGHLPAGLTHWQTGRFDVYRVNPPLVRMVATLPLLPQFENIDWKWEFSYSTSRPEWDLGKELVETYGRNYFFLLRIARLACLPFAVIALWIVWRWSTDLFGPTGGMLSVTAWAFSPMVLTNSHLISPDAPAAAMGAVACYTFRGWLRQPTARRAFLSGVMLGLVELTKFTWLILFLVWPIQWVLYRVIFRSDGRWHGMRSEARQLCFTLAISVFVINLGYGFEGSLTRLGDYQFLSHTLGGGRMENSNDWATGNRFEHTFLSHVPVPFPKNMVLGIDRQKIDFEYGYNSYLRGQWQDDGWWYYYIYGLLVKEPLALILLAVLAGAVAMRLRSTQSGRAEALNLLLAPMVLFTFVSSQTGFNHHLRYVLPAMIFIAIGVGILGSPAVTGRRTLRVVAWTLTATATAASLAVYPHSHAYFNVLVGGPRNGPWHLLHSNFDWGQDLLLLEEWAKQNSDRQVDGIVHTLPVFFGVHELTGLTRGEVPKIIPAQGQDSGSSSVVDGPVPGRYAVCVIALYDEDSPYEYFRALEPTDCVGYTFHIYEVTLAQANAIRNSNGLPPLMMEDLELVLNGRRDAVRTEGK